MADAETRALRQRRLDAQACLREALDLLDDGKEGVAIVSIRAALRLLGWPPAAGSDTTIRVPPITSAQQEKPTHEGD